MPLHPDELQENDIHDLQGRGSFNEIKDFPSPYFCCKLRSGSIGGTATAFARKD